jgi:hypothetical protein
MLIVQGNKRGNQLLTGMYTIADLLKVLAAAKGELDDVKAELSAALETLSALTTEVSGKELTALAEASRKELVDEDK